MCINELLKRAKKASASRTHEKRVEMLKQAKIVDKNGYYHKDYFSPETVAKDKKSGKPARK